jgi:hypothetical protein
MTTLHTEPHGAASPLAPDMDAARRFLNLLDPDAEFHTFQVFDDSPAKREVLASTIYGALDRLAATLCDRQTRGCGVYVTINETNSGRRKIQNVVRVLAVFADLDDAPLAPVMACDLEPHVIIESSPNKFHAYWLVEDVPLDQFTPIQKAIVKRFGSCKSCVDLPRVLRLPGFWHQKDKAKPFQSRIVHVAERMPYHVSEILAEFPPDTTRTANGHDSDAEYIDFAELIRLVMTSENYHDPLVRIAWRLLDDGMSRKKALAFMQGLMESAAGPRDDRWHARFNDLERTLETAEAKQAEEHVGHVNDVHPAAEMLAQLQGTPIEPDKPVTLDAPMFHGPLGKLCRDLDPHTEACPIGTLAALLTMFRNWLGREFHIPVGASRHCPTLYTLLVGPSATGRKGTAADNALMCMAELDRDWAIQISSKR